MIEAKKALEKRIELLDNEYNKLDFVECETLCQHEFLSNHLSNIQLEITKLKKAIKIINDNIK